MKRIIVVAIVILTLVLGIMPVAANEPIIVGDGEWCTDQGDDVWFCFEDGPTYFELKDYYTTTA